jgi:sulfoxide reductase heme-binding subunit YedZ
MSTSILWYATRGAGIVSLLLFTGVVALGILTSGRWQARTWPRFLTAGLHRDISLLSLVFLAIHIVTAVVDPYTALGPLAVLVPFAVDYRRFWLGLGAVGLDLLLAIVITSVFRTWFGVRTWRAVHWLSYAAWPIAVLHGIGTGTDTSAFWMQVIDVACVALVVGLATWRLLVEPPAPPQRALAPGNRSIPRDPAGARRGAALVSRSRPDAPLPANQPFVPAPAPAMRRDPRP